MMYNDMVNDLVNDLGCPTCGSKNFGNLEMKKPKMGLQHGKNNVIIAKNSGMQNLEIQDHIFGLAL